MTDKDIAALREEAEEARNVLSGSLTVSTPAYDRFLEAYAARCSEQMPELLAEVERLREIAREVADGDVVDLDALSDWICHWCGNRWNGDVTQHTSDCLVTKARALLGMENKRGDMT